MSEFLPDCAIYVKPSFNNIASLANNAIQSMWTTDRKVFERMQQKA